MTETTSLVVANQTESLRTTIPAAFTKHFKLRAGDRLDWDLQVVDGEMRLVVTPRKNE